MKEIIITENEKKEIILTVRGFNNMELLGILRLYEQQTSLILLKDIHSSKEPIDK